MTGEQIKEMLMRHEGYSSSVYYDTMGTPTGGFGHAFIKGSRLPLKMWKEIFELDYQHAVGDAYKVEKYFSLELTPKRRAVLINMLFNLGYYRFLSFQRMILAMQEKRWGDAANEMLDSKWSRQVEKRAFELANMMRTG